MVAVVAVAVLLSLSSVRQRLETMSGSEASAVRGLIWSQGVRIIADHPLGVGLGNYPAVVDRYYDAVDPHFEIRTYPHSILLAAWAETGPIGMCAYGLAWLSVALACAAALKRRSTLDSAVCSAAGAGLFSITAFWVVGLTHDVLYHKPVALAFALMAGTVLSILARAPQTRMAE